MHEKRIGNTLLAIVAALLLLNLGVMLAPATHAIPRTQYRAVVEGKAGHDATGVQQALDRESAQGWVYVGSTGNTLIFKK